MNYKTIFRDTLRLFGGSKLLWIFGAFSVINEFFSRVSIYSIGERPVQCTAYPILLISIYLSLVAKAGLIYSADKISSQQTLTFSEAWHFCTTRVKRFVGFYFISIPLLIFSIFIVEIVMLSEISTSLTELVGMLIDFFLTSVIILGLCTITLHKLETGPALWAGLSIVFNNFLQVLILNVIFLILEVLLIIAAGNTFFGLLVSVPFTVTMTLAYRVFITKASYPGLSNMQTTA